MAHKEAVAGEAVSQGYFPRRNPYGL